MMRNIHISTLLALLLVLVVVSCKHDKNDPDSTSYYSVSTTGTLVSQFRLRGSVGTVSRLDSIFFTIDAERGLIYNADSLPVGTNITHLLTTVTFGSTVGSARYLITYTEDGLVKRDTIAYASASTDSINFSGSVILEVNSYDNSQVQRYQVRVNVHRVDPDILSWPMADRRGLPGADGDVSAQCAVQWGAKMVCLTQGASGFSLSQAETPGGSWTTSRFEADFTPDVNSLAASSDALYLLDTDGNLYVSADARSWSATGQRWVSVIGGYASRVLGISAGERLRLDEYPRRDGFAPTDVPADFPIDARSQIVAASNSWSVSQQAVMVGGRLADGSVSRKTWGYDGNSWAVISSAYDTLPPLRDAILVSYVTHDIDTITFKATERPTWLLMGGFTADGTPNRTTYTSRNQGITWAAAGSGLQWPEYMPSMGRAQAFVCYQTLTAAAQAGHRVSRPVTEWQCPYIYVFGGYEAAGALQPYIWRGVIKRLTFQPLY